MTERNDFMKKKLMIMLMGNSIFLSLYTKQL